MENFDPQDWGYKASEVQPFDKGWIIAPLNLPVIAADEDGLWYCVLPEAYDSKWMGQARALLG